MNAEQAQATLTGLLSVSETDIATLVLLSLLLNLVGVVVCYAVAKYRGSRRVAFWTTMGLVFGPFAIPFVLWSTRSARRKAG